MYRFKNLRVDNDLVQQDLVNYLNIDRRSYAYFETKDNNSNLAIDTLVKLALLYNVSLDYILNLTNIKAYFPKDNIKQVIKLYNINLEELNKLQNNSKYKCQSKKS